MSLLASGCAANARGAAPKSAKEEAARVFPVPKLTIEEYSATAAPDGAPVVPLVQEGDAAWHAGKPVWSSESKGVAAQFWMATTTRELLMRIVVKSPRQANPYHERDLWRGDCVYVSLDARNDSTPEELAGGTLAPDDATFIFGLGSQGPEGRASAHGNPLEASRAQTDLIQSLVRDDAAQTTTYDLAIPYDRLSSAFGMSPAVGVALCIAHKDSDGKDQTWGRINGNKATPRQLNPVAVETGKGPLVAVAPRRVRLTDPNVKAEVTVAVRSPKRGEVRAMLVPSELPLTVAAEQAREGLVAAAKVPADGALHRYAVRVPTPAIAPETDRLMVTVDVAKNITQHHYQLTTPATLMARFGKHLDRLAGAAGDHALLRGHIDATRAVVQDAFGRLTFEMADHPERAREFLDQVESIDALMPTERYDWAAHVARGIPLVCAFSSDVDRTLQFYSLQLPYGFDATTTYPLTVYLHGMGDPNPLGGLSTSFDNSHQDTLFRTVKIDPADVPPSHRGFVVAPWARGNSFYRGSAENDVFQSIADVRMRFRVDADRIYMTGFSMGCSGAMALAARQPDMFAGVGLASGFGPWSETNQPYLVDNLRGTPLAVWVGELDSMAPAAKTFDQLLTAQKMEHRFEVLAQTPHTYPYTEFQKNVGYLMRFARQRPAKFSFTADTAEHAGRNGVRMSVQGTPPKDALPRFTCEVAGQTVTLTSENTNNLMVDLPALGLSGDVRVEWNGKEVYAGPARPVAVGQAAPGSRGQRR